MGNLEFVDIVLQWVQFVLSSLCLFILLLQLSNQLHVIIFSLMQSFIKPRVWRFAVSDLFFKILQFGDIGVQQVVKCLAFVFQLLSLFFQNFDRVCNILIFLMSSIIFIFKPFNLIPEALNFGCPVVWHSFHARVFSHKILDFNIGLLQLYFQCFNFLLEVDDAVLINVRLHSLLFLRSLFLVQQQRVLFLEWQDQIV